MFKSIARAEYTASNGNTFRVDIAPDGTVKFNARKNDHNQSVSVLSAADAAALVAFITSGNTAPVDTARVGVELAIECSDMGEYGQIHKAGCRDLVDGEHIGTATDIAGANIAADSFTGWGYTADDNGGYPIAPCARKALGNA
jgi:hypothetical protein